MQTTQAIIAQNSKKRSKLEDFKLKFGSTAKRSMTAAEKARAIELAKARWRARMNRE